MGKMKCWVLVFVVLLTFMRLRVKHVFLLRITIFLSFVELGALAYMIIFLVALRFYFTTLAQLGQEAHDVHVLGSL